MIKKIIKGIGLLTIIALVYWYLYRIWRTRSLSQPLMDITAPSYKDEPPETDTELSNQEFPTRRSKQDNSTKIDDLTRINGIGPKISKVFEKAGINTYQQLANLDSTKIQAILEAANIRLAPSYETWSKQAQFATFDDWEGLSKYLEYQKEKNE